MFEAQSWLTLFDDFFSEHTFKVLKRFTGYMEQTLVGSTTTFNQELFLLEISM